MARRVFLHVGLPKTGTSYLQTILWGNRETLKSAGVLLPGAERRDHLWASCVVRGDANTERRHRLAPSAWERLVDEIAQWEHDAVVSHEFFSSASTAQAAAAVDRLAPAEVHLVLTARDTLDLFTSSWQESVKNKSTVPMDQYCTSVSADPLEVWNWRALDLGLVLERWASAVPAERVHVLPLCRATSESDDLWQRFATLLGIAPDSIDARPGFANRSMGVVETETLRRINATLEGFDRPFDRGVWIRTYLADERLVPRGGERFWPSPDQVADCRRRGECAVALIRDRGFDVRGCLEELLTPQRLPARRYPDSVTDAEVAEVAIDLVGSLLTDVRRTTNQLRELRVAQTEPEPRPDLSRRVPLVHRAAARVRRALPFRTPRSRKQQHSRARR